MLNLIDFVKTESWRPSQKHPITVSFLTLLEQKTVELNNKQPDNGRCNTKHNVVNFKKEHPHAHSTIARWRTSPGKI